jgi:signal peptidase I
MDKQRLAAVFNYTGPSMNPTLKAGDILRVVPYRDRPIRVGDVVVFRCPGKSHIIVHRVSAVGVNCFQTRGDANRRVDPWGLKPGDIIGQVVAAKRKTAVKLISGGILGRLTAAMLARLKKADQIGSMMLHPIYRRIAESGIFLRLSFLFPRVRVLSFRRPNGNELQLFMGNYMVGRYLPGTNRWRIIRPFRLFVDEEALKRHRRRHKYREDHDET